eukprot:10826474-Lingulodinium_polyedra.AAC.1
MVQIRPLLGGCASQTAVVCMPPGSCASASVRVRSGHSSVRQPIPAKASDQFREYVGIFAC